MKEKILEVLKAMGFTLEELDDHGYGFQYEGNNYLYMYNEDDEEFLSILLPIALNHDEENDVSIYQAIDKVNSTLKYVKAYILHEDLWLSYERELFGEEELKQVLCRMIQHLDASLIFLRKVITSSDEDSETISDVIDNDTVTGNEEDAA